MLKLFTIIKNKTKITNLAVMILSAVTLYCQLPAFSLTADNLEPITIVADTFEIDYKNHYAVYSKNVELNQGSRKMNSDNLHIYFVNNKVTSVIATSKPQEKQNLGLVSYFEKMDKQESAMQAKAKKFTYDPNINKIILEQNATIKQGDKELNSELIDYDIKKQVAHMPKIQNRRTKITIG